MTVNGQTISTALHATDVVAPTGYDSYDDAVAVRDALTAAIDEQLEATTDDDVYGLLMQLRADLAAAVPGDPNTLPRVMAVTPIVTVPALVVAHRLYGDLALVDDLIARNTLAHPGFVPGGLPLEVLSHGR